ncbi:thermonuclease family protein [Pseudolabrys sp.]|uniref:thermonuclease family protein n=1 Tax=Pseudolabrys sp. TaxID=1960880 RepID=UPI003D128824
MRLAYAVLLIALSAAPAAAEEIFGIPTVVDGDTLYVASVKIRLSGIDAPETDQICLDDKGQNSNCGLQAKQQLQERFGSARLTCKLADADMYGRRLGDCFLGNESISRWLVRSGWALAFRRYSQSFIADEDQARERKVGLWAGAFIAPWDWRHRNTHTIVLGAYKVPRDAQRQLLSSTVASAPPNSACVIKANIKRRECIYHVPGGRFYDKLKMEPVATRRWFCSAAEAEAAGCRKSKL